MVVLYFDTQNFYMYDHNNSLKKGYKKKEKYQMATRKIKLVLTVPQTDPAVPNVLANGVSLIGQGDTASAALDSLRTQVQAQVDSASANAAALIEVRGNLDL